MKIYVAVLFVSIASIFVELNRLDPQNNVVNISNVKFSDFTVERPLEFVIDQGDDDNVIGIIQPKQFPNILPSVFPNILPDVSSGNDSKVDETQLVTLKDNGCTTDKKNSTDINTDIQDVGIIFNRDVPVFPQAAARRGARQEMRQSARESAREALIQELSSMQVATMQVANGTTCTAPQACTQVTAVPPQACTPAAALMPSATLQTCPNCPNGVCPLPNSNLTAPPTVSPPAPLTSPPPPPPPVKTSYMTAPVSYCSSCPNGNCSSSSRLFRRR